MNSEQSGQQADIIVFKPVTTWPPQLQEQIPNEPWRFPLAHPYPCGPGPHGSVLPLVVVVVVVPVEPWSGPAEPQAATVVGPATTRRAKAR
jgi:hypothetical protein